MEQNITFPKYFGSRQLPNVLKDDLPLMGETQALIAEAQELGLDWELIQESNFVRISFNGNDKYFRNGTGTLNANIGRSICADKSLTRVFLKTAGLPVANGYALLREDGTEDRLAVFNALQKPLVIKPASSTHGNGVRMNVATFEEMDEWVSHLFKTTVRDAETSVGKVMVEETAAGNEYRVIATPEKMLAAMHRHPANVIGDGVLTIAQLIEIKNQDPLRNISPLFYPHIEPDADMEYVLQSQNLTLESVPEKDVEVPLRFISNIMAGGDAVDVTDEVHTSVAEMATKVARAIPGMTMVGFDLMTTDIGADQSSQQCWIIEVNSAPEWSIHDFPMVGENRRVARAILQLAFPGLGG